MYILVIDSQLFTIVMFCCQFHSAMCYFSVQFQVPYIGLLKMFRAESLNTE